MASRLHRNRLLLFHTAFWAVYVTFTINHISIYQNSPKIEWGAVFIETFFSVGYVFIISYLNYFYFIPFLLIKNKIGRFVLAFVCTFALISVLNAELEHLVVKHSARQALVMSKPQFVIQGIISDLFIVLFVGMLRFASDWLELDSRRRELENEKLSAELKFLKAQVNPHFLFNTLNNLYYLTAIRSDIAPVVISKLSEVMRYVIYDASQEKVELAREIEYMRHYVGLERLRLDEGIPLEFEVDGRTDVLITPMILMTFLENAFKHGVSNGSDHSWVKARLEVNDTRLIYNIGNSKPRSRKPGAQNLGIGLKNVKRRLDLCYPGNYTLEFEESETSFSVALIIKWP